MDEEILNALIKRAKGYTYNEVQEEYSVKEDGEIALTKRKVSEKYCPPDSAALKTYMDICADKDVRNYTDEELQKERERLLQTLLEEERQNVNNDANKNKKDKKPQKIDANKKSK